MPLPMLNDLKAHLNITGSGDDAELTDMLAAAVDVVEGIVGPLQAGATTETHYGANAPFLLLHRSPILELTSVAVQDWPGGSQFALDSDALDVNADAGIVRLSSGLPFYGNVTVTYSAGRVTVPAAVHMAILVIAKQMWESQRGAQPLPLQGAQDDAPADASFASSIPRRARELLQRYASNSQVA